MYFKKTIILSSLDDSADKAVVNVEKFKNRIEGQIKLYNYKQEPKGILTLGFLKDGVVVKAGLQKCDNMKYSFVVENEQDIKILDDSIACALVNIKEGKAKPLLFGASDGRLPKSTDLRLASGIQLFEHPASVEATEDFLDEQQIEYDDELKAEIEGAIEDNMPCNKCAECKYRQAFYSTLSSGLQEEVFNEKEHKFYEDVKEQLNELFEKFPEEEFLKDIIPNSKWVKVDYDDTENYYVVGLIYDNGELKYICYGLPGLAGEDPPQDIGKYAQWLPLVAEKEDGFGYWLSYQDAENGENIEMEII